MRRLLSVLAVLALAFAGGGYLLSAPSTIPADALSGHEPDLKNGRRMFLAGGCASCHAAPDGPSCDAAKSKDKLRLVGGRCLNSPFGTFYVPNISPHPEDGIGGWSTVAFVNAMKRGVSPDGRHYYPSFPYTSYANMSIGDVIDLKAYIDTLASVEGRAPDHDLPLLFRVRRGIGLWKLRYLDDGGDALKPDGRDPVAWGRYLVEGPGHCAQCHTPRDLLGGLDYSRYMAGAPNPDGEGWIPNITPHKDGIGSWSGTDIVYALEMGLTPDFDTFGGSMVAVQENMAELPAEDREAIAAYLMSIEPLATKKPADPAE